MLKTPENQKNKANEFSTVGINPIELCKTVKSTGLGRENYISAKYEGPIFIT
jgi:hypothetical protein